MQPFRVALCQVRAHDIEHAEANLAELERSLDEAGAQGAQLVCLPEGSYPAYYLRDDRPYDRSNVRAYAEVVELIRARARQYGYWVAAGLAVPHDDGTVTNSGVVFTPSGEIAGRYDKAFLWHFDNNWFARGTTFPVFEAPFAKFGVLICADGRQPEIARLLTLNGAEVIVDLTAWVSGGPSVDKLMNVQCEYMMPVRAYENGVWVVAADKWGEEDGSILYAGRSSVFDPRGHSRFCAPSDSGGVFVYDLEPAHGEPLRRRPSLYRTLARPTASLPVTAMLEEPIVPAREEKRIAVVPAGEDFDAKDLIAKFVALRKQATDLVVFPGMQAFDGWQVDLAGIESAVREHGGAVAFGVASKGCSAWQSSVLVTPAGAIEHVATHGRGIRLHESPFSVTKTSAGNTGLLSGDEGFVPEVARAQALEGAEVIAWPMFEPHHLGERTARTRGDENGTFVAAAWPGGGMIATPSGGVATSVPAGTTVAMAAQVNRATARMKVRAPGTNVILDRHPELYGPLVG